jgi:hypothetical protein
MPSHDSAMTIAMAAPVHGLPDQDCNQSQYDKCHEQRMYGKNKISQEQVHDRSILSQYVHAEAI